MQQRQVTGIWSGKDELPVSYDKSTYTNMLKHARTDSYDLKRYVNSFCRLKSTWVSKVVITPSSLAPFSDNKVQKVIHR